MQKKPIALDADPVSDHALHSSSRDANTQRQALPDFQHSKPHTIASPSGKKPAVLSAIHFQKDSSHAHHIQRNQSTNTQFTRMQRTTANDKSSSEMDAKPSTPIANTSKDPAPPTCPPIERRAPTKQAGTRRRAGDSTGKASEETEKDRNRSDSKGDEPLRTAASSAKPYFDFEGRRV
ncbi:hypothetical protein BT93_B0338 [Corymbia citriodora subsp. variegata]|nr:hypothetical protein BT93_B0338 [Corymbia citriodora subsp. variegata]